MNPEPSMLPERDERLGDILAAWIEAAERGQAPDSAEWLACHAEFAVELQEFLANHARVQAAAEPLCQAVRALAAIAPSRGDTPHLMSQDRTAVVPAAEMIGRTVGEHELLEEVGQGGMGLVYRARHRRLQRLVALKMLRANVLLEAGDVQRFRNEAEVLAQLDHPHIVPVHDVGEYEGRVYFSMKLIEGGGLDKQLDRFANDPRAAAGLVAQVARAVHHAHQRGILHRDLKPSNILLDRDGQPHVSDFGLAKRIEADVSLTQTRAIVGTPSYMAPEQTRGQKGEVTTATDMYGLGAVLYALLTGRPPFEGETVLETLELVREREPEPPRRINAKVDRELGRPRRLGDDEEAFLRTLLAASPQELDYPDVSWTVPLLQEVLYLGTGQWFGERTVRRALERLDYVWKRPRYVLAPDPEREKKTAYSAANPGLAAPQRGAGRGRNRPAALPAVACRMVPTRRGCQGLVERPQRPAGHLRRDELADGLAAVAAAEERDKRGLSSVPG